MRCGPGVLQIDWPRSHDASFLIEYQIAKSAETRKVNWESSLAAACDVSTPGRGVLPALEYLRVSMGKERTEAGVGH